MQIQKIQNCVVIEKQRKFIKDIDEDFSIFENNDDLMIEILKFIDEQILKID